MCRFTLALILCLVAGSRQLSITEFEVPSTVEVDNDAELRCRYKLDAGETPDSLFVKWWVTKANGDRKQLYQRFAGHLEKGVAIRQVVTKDDVDTVVLRNVTAADSGVYECEVSNIDEVRQHQQLTVFTQGSGPQLNISEIEDGPDEDTDEDVQIECRAEDVAPLPDIVLTVDGQEYNMTESVSGPDEAGLYDIVGNLTFSKSDIDGSDVRCELFYEDTSIKHPQYIDALTYDPSGTVDAGARSDAEPEEVIKQDASTESVIPNQSGDSTHTRISLGVLVVVAAFVQLPL